MSFLIECDIGDSIKVRGTLVDIDGVAVTGATVTATALPPSGTEADLGAASEVGSTGVYEVTFDPTESGHNHVRFESASPKKAAAEGVVFVRESRFS